jgi:acetyl-CoA C-acetyltransferase
MKRVAILAAKRTAIGSFGGMFKEVGAVQLGSEALRAAIAASGLAPGDIEEVVVGNVLSANLGENAARQIALSAGVPMATPAYAVNKPQAPHALPSARYGARRGNVELVDLLLRDGLNDAFAGYHMSMTAEILADRCRPRRRRWL